MKEYSPTPQALNVLQKGKILARGESPQEMFQRVTNTLFSVEPVWGVPAVVTSRHQEHFADLMAEKAISPGTPTLTNAGRPDYDGSALSSCVVIPTNLNKKDEAMVKIRSYYKMNMGSGFDFSPYSNPVELLRWLNDFSAQETATGIYDRYIGNMGNLSVRHPDIREFIRAKREQPLPHFNISVDVDETFMDAAKAGKSYTLADGTKIDAGELLSQMAESAHYNGDPGLIYLDRMNRDNPVSQLSPYTSTPPCSEMGLAAGETCQFGYINLAKFVDSSGKGMDWRKLVDATSVMTRALDNAIELSCGGYPDPESLRLANLKRKIGIGVCGLADTLLTQDLPYDSTEAREFTRSVLSVINYTSKIASITLAGERGSCGAMNSLIGNKYYDGFLADKFTTDTPQVTAKMWTELSQFIQKHRKLRNILTTALPPTGRASILMDAVSSVEPFFSLSNASGGINSSMQRFVDRHANGQGQQVLAQALAQRSFQETSLPGKECLKTATEISPFDHLRMIGALSGKNGVYDEAASKTINLPSSATVSDVRDIFLATHDLGIKNISVYRDGSHLNQPSQL